ncbi:MAG: RICIN domain-containing protein [Eubacteriales bacterium]|nr:RICIN domain-containing protein [Eubacteriales bacterium]
MKKKFICFTTSAIMLLSFGTLNPKFLPSPVIVEAAYENTWANTGNQREDIVKVAETQIGYHEGANNDTKYNRWNGTISGYPVDGYGYPWCQCFVSWCANQAGIATDIIPRTAGTYVGRDFFVKQGTFEKGRAYGGNYTPRRGDIIYFGSGSSPSHVGIVSGCDGGTVYTIEGNYSDSVGTRAISLSNSYIIGYGVPNYVQPVIKKPSFSNLSISNGHYVFNTNEEIHFNATSDTATSYCIGIDKDGQRIITESMNNGTYSISFQEAGEYSAYVTASNVSGYIDSTRVNFKVFSPVNIGDEREVFIQNSKTGMYLTVNGEDDGAENVYGSEKGDTKKQLWKIKKQSNGTYRIALATDGRCLEVFQAGKEQGTNISVWKENLDFVNQEFQFYRMNKAFYIKPVCSDLFVDMGDSEPYNVATYGYAEDWGPQMFNIIDVTNAPTWADIKTDEYRTNFNVDETINFSFTSDNATEYYINIYKDSQRIIHEKTTTGKYSVSIDETGYYTACVTARNSNGWIDSEYIGIRVLQPVDLGDSRVVYIGNIENDLLLSVNDDDISGMANVFGASFGAANKQEWILKKQSDGTYKIALNGDGRCLEVFKAGTTNGTNVSVYDETKDFINQKFYIYNLFDSYYIKPVCSDLFVDMTYDEINNVATYGYADNWIHQKFNIIPTSKYYIKGDCNSDSKLSAMDAIVFRKYLLGVKNADLANSGAADLDGDGVINIVDFIMLKNLLVSP